VETKNSRFFPYLVGLSALLVAGSAAFYSVFGLSKLFSGATMAVIIMAGSLEFAKLVSASFLYRYWDEINRFMKTYLIIGVVTLVMITSAGIFGFLSNAYQGATVSFEKESTALLYKEDRLDQLSDDKKFLKEELEAAVAELPDNYRTAKRKLREEYQPKINDINITMMTLKQEIGDLKIALVETGVDVGPAIYLARVFDTDVDSIVKYFIFMLIAVFDPLAVVLVISYNLTLQVRIRDDENQGPVSGKNGKTEKQKKKPKRLGLYKEGKSVIEKVVKETFKPDSKIEKKHKEVIEEEPRGGIFVPEKTVNTSDIGKGGIVNSEYVPKNKI
jgi:hypothetical protein|tara:strand:- start:146 stop:1138 length:993 start_codon:yes stop_codon:yes gene_type:complete